MINILMRPRGNKYDENQRAQRLRNKNIALHKYLLIRYILISASLFSFNFETDVTKIHTIYDE